MSQMSDIFGDNPSTTKTGSDRLLEYLIEANKQHDANKAAEQQNVLDQLKKSNATIELLRKEAEKRAKEASEKLSQAQAEYQSTSTLSINAKLYEKDSSN